ncbi:PEP-CTERM system histidine kinase PrsK [Bowmanella sp. Y26]|uniref:XrtA/PEP-CTERM system histidine kinase PrsK n=1 Tax=Bowmanella yangjiangensis TaxID=2811230 RepID=UPI001BDCBC2A|nr:XrtA/PEP-CTERM system histidine kinase PrsK [Bowmanella yangjiangensis]MBT1064868.1 PEP-CTERM system histidine kinase PrsK [Bowmanella yangjiangensis]
MLDVIGYSLCLVGNLLLFLLLLTVRRPGLPKRLLLVAVVTNLLWALTHIGAATGVSGSFWLLFLEGAKSLIWLMFISSVLKRDLHRLSSLLSQPVTLFSIALPLMLLLLGAPGFLSFKWLLLIQTVIPLVMLILLETLYRQAGSERWHYKPLVLYLGATSLFDFVMYADATMVSSIDPMFWTARGYIYALLLPALVIAIRRIKHWGIEIFVSRDVVLHSSLLLLAGGYLFVMAIAGYAIRYIGGDWSGAVQLVLLFLSLILLLVLFLSNTFRARIKVFITKHFFANQYDYREEWLKLSQSLSGSENNLRQVFDNGLNSLMAAINYSSGMLLKFNGKNQQIMSSIGHPPLTDIEKEVLEQLKVFLQQKHWLVDIEELRYRPFVYEGLKVNHAILNQCRFQLVLPFYRDEQLWGVALLYAPTEQKIRLDWELRDYLNAVIAQVANYLFHYEAAKEVAENAQFAAFNRMSAFVLHDLKNVLAQIDLILCNAQQHKNNPEFIEDTFETLAHTKSRMEKMLRQLTEKKEALPSSTRTLNLGNLVNKVIQERCQGLLPIPKLAESDEIELILDEEKFSNVLYHLISNAQQATPDDGSVELKVKVSKSDAGALLEITDTGCGMSQEFIATRLFKPFDTTKGNAGMGIGAYDAKNYIEKVGGRIEVVSQVGQGTRFSLFLPATAAIDA